MVLLESYFSHDWFELTVMTYRFRTQINIQFTLSLQICSDSSDNLYILPMVFGESFIASCLEITTPYSNLAKVSKYISDANRLIGEVVQSRRRGPSSIGDPGLLLFGGARIY